jgi:serine protease Do
MSYIGHHPLQATEQHRNHRHLPGKRSCRQRLRPAFCAGCRVSEDLCYPDTHGRRTGTIGRTETIAVPHRFFRVALPSLLLVTSVLLPARPPAGAQPAPPPTSQVELIRGLLPTVVSINSFVADKSSTATTEPDTSAIAGDKAKPLSGSGLIIDPGGVILTNNHTVAGGSDMRVTFSDGSHLPGRLLAQAPRIDLALVKVDPPRPLTAARWGDSDAVQIGQRVFVIGNALGVGASVTSGIVSALNRNVQQTPYDDLIQTDAAINHGNSGGPLFDRRGEVIGIATAILSPTPASTGLGFAIPANDARFVAERMLQEGQFRQGYIGIKTEQMTQDMAAALGMARPVGSVVAAVRLGEPAEAAGLRVGDVVVRYDNQPVTDDRALLRAIVRSRIGQAVAVTVLRDGHETTIEVTPTAWPEPPTTLSVATPAPAMLVPPDLGLSLSALTADLRARHGLQMQRGGVLVDAVAPATDAFDRGLQAGDVLLRVQATEVGSPREVQAAIDAARAAHNTFVMALVLGKDEQLFGPHWVALRVGPAS